MTHNYQDNPEFGGAPRWPGLIWSTLLLLAICGILLVMSYLGPRSISPSFRATESPSTLSGH